MDMLYMCQRNNLGMMVNKEVAYVLKWLDYIISVKIKQKKGANKTQNIFFDLVYTSLFNTVRFKKGGLQALRDPQFRKARQH